MPVQIIENRARVEATVLALGEAGEPERPGWRRTRLRVERVTEVPGLPNLLADEVGATIDCWLRLAPLEGSRVKLQVRKAGPALYFGEVEPGTP